MNNSEIIQIIENKKGTLQKIGYNVTDTNFEKVVNGFISIANSMMTENMNKIPNAKIAKKISISYKFLERAVFDFNRVYSKLMMKEDLTIEDIKSKRYNPLGYVLPSSEDTAEQLENKRTLNYCKFLINQLDNHSLRDFGGHIEDIKEYILSNNDILDSFNKGELTKLEEEMIIKLKNDTYKPKKKIKKKIILSKSIKTHEDYIMDSMGLDDDYEEDDYED